MKENFEFNVAMVGPAVIDKIGISRATKLAVSRVLRKFEEEAEFGFIGRLAFRAKIL